MRFGDLLDPERGPQALLKLALYPFILLVVLQFVLCFLAQLPPAGGFFLFCLLLLLSPLAYLIRRSRRGPPATARTAGGAERTPLLPSGEEVE